MEPNSLVELARNAADLVIPEAMRGYLDKRRRAAFDILMEELRIGNIHPEEAAARDDVAAMFVKFFQAMAQGAAFSNLRILAKILAGKTVDAEKTSDDFIMWADAIGGMLHEEVVFLATLVKHYEHQVAIAKEDEAPNLDERRQKPATRGWKILRRHADLRWRRERASPHRIRGSCIRLGRDRICALAARVETRPNGAT